MPGGAAAHSYGWVFNEVAHDYERYRPAYPDELVDRVCQTAVLEPGSRILEIGCGTGQLTRSLLARGLRVTAVEPGEELIERARTSLDGLGAVRFLNVRFEDAQIRSGRFAAAFSASAMHWIDPDVSWRRAADALVDGGTLALLSYFGLEHAHSFGDQRALRAALGEIAPDLLAEWPTYRELDPMHAGVAQRSSNISEAWAWLGGYEIAREHAAGLFERVQFAALPMLVEHSAEELNALLGTMSFWSRLSPGQRAALARSIVALERQLDRPIRSSVAACLLTGQRRPRTSSRS